jgi:hypothetical protein
MPLRDMGYASVFIGNVSFMNISRLTLAAAFPKAVLWITVTA